MDYRGGSYGLKMDGELTACSIQKNGGWSEVPGDHVDFLFEWVWYCGACPDRNSFENAIYTRMVGFNPHSN